MRKDCCRHFTGIQNKSCKKGIAYETVREAPEGKPYRFACLFEGGSCAERSAWTQAEIEAQEAEYKKLFAAMMKAREAIIATGHKQGAIICPCCGTGMLRYSIARINGHVHAACTSEGCVSWME